MQRVSLATTLSLSLFGASRQHTHLMHSSSFCGWVRYDLYTTHEPSVFEAMALVHSRIRRVVFGRANPFDGGLGGTGPDTAVHCLAGTNHHYRVFFCAAS